jgi:hypothetical protein
MLKIMRFCYYKIKSNRVCTKIIKLLNSGFATWFFPTVVIGFVAYSYKEHTNDAVQNRLASEITAEVSFRLRTVKDATNFCNIKIIQNSNNRNDQSVRDAYESIFSNLLTANPICNNLDSIEYSTKFRAMSTLNLLRQLPDLNSKFKKKIDVIIPKIYNIKDYYVVHQEPDSGTFGELLKIVNDSLNFL